MHNLICPVCSSTLLLTSSQKSLACEQGHLFDLAKQGYVNLLLSQNKKSKNPGDTPQMVKARTEFLNLSLYEGISDLLARLIKEHSILNIANYCDLACGEGYYTDRLHRHLGQNNPSLITSGIDISSPAIKTACKRNKTIQWMIASTKKIPMESSSQELVSGLFFHFDHNEIARILKTDGLLILANTGAQHLIELRSHLYDSVKQQKNAPMVSQSDCIRHVIKIPLKQNISLTSSESIMQLLAMTPHYWRAKPEKKQALAKLVHLDLSIDIEFDIFTKK